MYHYIGASVPTGMYWIINCKKCVEGLMSHF